MIWGCQWNAMLKFLLTGNEASHVTARTNVSHDLTSSYSTGGTDYTGSVEYNDIASNIYDLEGNIVEWNQNVFASEYRSFYGGSFNSGLGVPGTMLGTYPGREFYKFMGAKSSSSLGSRLSLYIV